jgi:MFS family permease
MTPNPSRKWAILFAVVVTQFAVPFMLSAVGVCLPSIGREYAASAIALSLVESVFLCVNAMLLLPFGRFGDICGRGGVFLFGLLIFALATTGLTMAPNMEAFLVVRGIQAVGGAMTLATGLALLYDAFPFEERGRALGISAAGIFLGISAGPFLGGIIAARFGWRWVFYAGMAPCALAFLICLRNLEWRLSPKPGERFDWWGAITSAAGIGLVVFGSAQTENTLGWLGMGGGILLCILFVVIESRTRVPSSISTSSPPTRPFPLGSPRSVSWMRRLRDFLPSEPVSAIRPGHEPGRGRHAPGGTAGHPMPCVAPERPTGGQDPGPYHGRDRGHGHGRRDRPCRDADRVERLGAVVAVLAVAGLGIGVFSTPSLLVVMSAVDESRYGIASAMSGQSRTLGMTLCMAAVTVAMARFVGNHPLGPEVFDQYLLAMRWLFIGFGILGFVGAALSFLAKKRIPAGSPNIHPGPTE